jgi:hypothetical protein
MEKLEQEHIKSRTTPNVDFAVPKEMNKRSMSSAKPLREFEPMDWVPIDYGEVFDKRRPFPNQMGMARALEVDFPLEKCRKWSRCLKCRSRRQRGGGACRVVRGRRQSRTVDTDGAACGESRHWLMTKMLKHFTPIEDSSYARWKANNVVTLKCELITKNRPP